MPTATNHPCLAWSRLSDTLIFTGPYSSAHLPYSVDRLTYLFSTTALARARAVVDEKVQVLSHNVSHETGVQSILQCRKRHVEVYARRSHAIERGFHLRWWREPPPACEYYEAAEVCSDIFSNNAFSFAGRGLALTEKQSWETGHPLSRCFDGSSSINLSLQAVVDKFTINHGLVVRTI